MASSKKVREGIAPLFAAKINLSETQFMDIWRYIETYDFSQFSLTGNQCTTFAAQIAKLGGVSLSHTIAIPVQQKIWIGRDCITLWNDSTYSSITLSSPDILEKSLIEAVQAGNAEYALEWYINQGLASKCLRCRMRKLSETVAHFPSRYRRMLLFR